MNPILESLVAAAPRVRPIMLIPFFAGSLRDHSGYENHVTTKTAPLHWATAGKSRGLVSPSNGRLTVASSASLAALSDMTVFLAADFRSQKTNEFILYGLGNTVSVYYIASHLIFYDGTISRSIATTSVPGSKSLAFSMLSGGVGQGYLDGSSIGSFSGVSTVTPAAGNWYLLGTTGTNGLRSPSKCLIVYPGVLSPEEVSSVHAWTETLRSPSLPADRRYFDMGSLVPVGGDALAAYDFGDVANREVVDKSGNGNTATANGEITTAITELGRAASNSGITGSDAGFTTPSLTVMDDYTFEALLFLRSDGVNNAGRLFHSTNINVYFNGTPVSSVVVTVTGITGSPWFVNGIPDNQWFHLVITRKRSSGAMAIYVNGVAIQDTTAGTEAANLSGAYYLFNNAGAGAGIRAMDGVCRFLRIYDRHMDAAEVLRRYAPIARKVMFEQTFEYVPVTISNLTSGQIPGTDYNIASGTWKVDEGFVDGRWRTWVECVVGGVLWRSNQFGFGTWDFDYYKALDTQYASIGFVAGAIGNPVVSSPTYSVVFNGPPYSNQLRFYEAGVGALASTVAPYFASATRYSYRVTRGVDGNFKLYIKGGIYESWTEALSASDTTTTTSLFVTFDMDPGDRLYLDRQMLGAVPPGPSRTLSLIVGGSGTFNVADRDLEFSFRHYINAGLNIDIWEAFELFHLDGAGARMHGGNSITSAWSVWEVTVWDPVGGDFLGGGHGNQVLTSAAITVDGTPVSMAASSTTHGEVIEFTQVSALYRISDGMKVCDVTTVWTWTADNMTQSTQIDWVLNHDPTAQGVYIGQFPILRSVDGEQITSWAEFDWGATVVDVSSTGHVGAETLAAPWQIRVYDDAAAIDFMVSWFPGGTTPVRAFVSNAAPYNKVYCNHAGAAVVAPATWTSVMTLRWLGMYR